MSDKLHLPLGSLGKGLVAGLPYSRPQTPGLPAQVQLGWIGLGAMGYLIARNLANYRAAHLDQQQPPLLVWNRSKEKSERLLRELGERKVAIAQSVVDIATASDIVLISLSGDEVVKSVYKEIAAALQAQPPTKRKIFVETSTVSRPLRPIASSSLLTHTKSQDISQRGRHAISFISHRTPIALTQRHSFLFPGEIDALISAIPHCHLVSSPVFGPPAMAENATLIFALSGDYRSKKEVAYTLVPAIGRRVLDLGGNVEKGDPVMPILFALIDEERLYYPTSTDIQAHRKLSGPGLSRADRGGIHDCRKVRNRSRTGL